MIDLAPNAAYSAKSIAKPLLQASADNSYIESVCNHLRKKGKAVPTGDDVFYHLAGRKLGIRNAFARTDSLIKRSLIKARRFISFRTPVPIAIDCHDIPYYGEGNGELARWIRGCKNQRGTNQAFTFITACIVVKGRRFVIAILPVTVFDTFPGLLERLIRGVRKRVRIRYAFLDRGFYSVECVRKLNACGVLFAMPVIRHNAKKPEKDILKLMRRCHAEGKTRFTYTLGTKTNNVDIRVVVKKEEDDEDVVGFATNTKIPARTIGEWYGKRWGIETGYRVAEVFRARTCARKSAAVRLLLNMLSFVLYNAWVLANIAMRFLLRGGRFLKGNRSDIIAYEFCKGIEEFIHSIP